MTKAQVICLYFVGLHPRPPLFGGYKIIANGNWIFFFPLCFARDTVKKKKRQATDWVKYLQKT